MRFLLSLVILTIIIVYLVTPFVKYIMKFINKETERIEQAFTNKNKKKKDDVK